jgi:diguanylate cyclase (GGDEF)-like protein/PAS domain S-box-containing protein
MPGGNDAVGGPEWAVYDAVVKRLPDAALLYADDRLVHANPAALGRLRSAGLLPPGADLEAVDLYAEVDERHRRRLQDAMRAAAQGRAVPATRLVFRNPVWGSLVASCSFHPLTLRGMSYVQVIARDVTARAQGEQALLESEAQFRAVFDHSPVGVAVVEDHRFTVVNPAMCRILGRSADQLVGLSVDDVTAKEDLLLNAQVVRTLESGSTVAQVHKRYRKPDGTIVWGELTAVRVHDAGRTRSLVHLRDVTVQRQAAEDLRRLASRDALTGLANRTLLEDRLHVALSRRPEQRTRLAILFLDLDGFKRINDALGHAVGDSVLRAVARRLADVVRPSDTVARWGGDEFVVLLDGVDSGEEVMSVVRRVERAVSAPIAHRDDELLCTASVGIAHAKPHEHPVPGELIQAADSAMYRAKQSGRNRHSVFDAALREAAAQRSRVEALLRSAVDGDRIVLHYQPLLELAARRIVGVEVLLRLVDDDGRLLYPDRFLDVAIESGVMPQLERVVMERSCGQVAEWVAAGHDLTLSVNVCAEQLRQVDDFEAHVLEALAESGLASDRLVCEVTEHALIDTSPATVAGIVRLQARGVEFSVDDFGTGYASMTYLQVLPVQEIKVDRRFVARAGHDRAAAAIVRAVSGLATELGMRCVAEGIEDEQTHELARRLGAGHGQGYLYAKPAPADQLAALLGPPDWVA